MIKIIIPLLFSFSVAVSEELPLLGEMIENASYVGIWKKKEPDFKWVCEKTFIGGITPQVITEVKNISEDWVVLIVLDSPIEIGAKGQSVAYIDVATHMIIEINGVPQVFWRVRGKKSVVKLEDLDGILEKMAIEKIER